MSDFHCLSRCHSPRACDGFGYCRERNCDGKPMSNDEIARRKAESDAEWQEQNGQFGVGT